MDNWVESKQLPVHFLSASGLVFKDGKVLLVRTSNRGWEFPGGVIEQGEDLITGLKREILEESGIVAEPRSFCGCYQRLTKRPGYGPLEGMMIPTTVTLTFVCDYVSGTERITDESMETGWFTPEEALNKVTTPHIRKELEDLLDFNGKQCFASFKRDENGEITFVNEKYL